jgi:hypothetical protein
VQVRTIAEMKMADDDGIAHRLEYGDYSGPLPLLAQRDLPAFVLRERAIEEARRRGYRWRS